MDNEFYIHFLPSEIKENANNFIELEDKGKLFLLEDKVVFEGKKYRVDMDEITEVIFSNSNEKINKMWITLKYRMNDKEGVCYIRDGKYLGWKGIFGGNSSLEKLIEEKYIL